MSVSLRLTTDMTDRIDTLSPRKRRDRHDKGDTGPLAIDDVKDRSGSLGPAGRAGISRASVEMLLAAIRSLCGRRVGMKSRGHRFDAGTGSGHDSCLRRMESGRCGCIVKRRTRG